MPAINLRHAVFNRIAELSKAHQRSKPEILDGLLKMAFSEYDGKSLPLFEPSGMYTNHGRPISISEEIHTKIKRLALDCDSSMMDVASSLLAAKLNLSQEELIAQQHRGFKPRDWTVHLSKTGSAGLRGR